MDFGLAEYKKDLKQVSMENWRSSGKPTGGFHEKNMEPAAPETSVQVTEEEMKAEEAAPETPATEEPSKPEEVPAETSAPAEEVAAPPKEVVVAVAEVVEKVTAVINDDGAQSVEAIEETIVVDCEGVDLCRYGTLCIMQLAFPDAVYLVDSIQGGKVLMNACKPALESSYIHLLIFSSLLNKLSAVAAVCPQRRPVLLAAIRPTFCPGGASRRNSAGMTNMLMVTTTMGMLHGAVAHHTTAAFIRVVGSAFVQKYLDEGPRMVRNVFRLAKENAPAIILIDEVDAIATARFDAQTEAKDAYRKLCRLQKSHFLRRQVVPSKKVTFFETAMIPSSVVLGILRYLWEKGDNGGHSLSYAPMCGEKDIHVFGIFDGHRGAAAAEFSARALPGFLQSLGSIKGPSDALLEAFVKTDVAFRNELDSHRKSKGVIQKDWHNGCTAIVALIVRNKLFVANAGDCRAMLCRAGSAYALSKDHVASCPEERERIISEGRQVKWQVDTWRVGPAALQVTLSIGDDDMKPVVTAEPEITETILYVEDEYLRWL
ncbi:unnamed protein product [Camellia sinensis]